MALFLLTDGDPYFSALPFNERGAPDENLAIPNFRKVPFESWWSHRFPKKDASTLLAAENLDLRDVARVLESIAYLPVKERHWYDATLLAIPDRDARREYAVEWNAKTLAWRSNLTTRAWSVADTLRAPSAK